MNEKVSSIGDTVLFMPGYINYPKFTGIVLTASDRYGVTDYEIAVRGQKKWLMANVTLLDKPLPFRLVLIEKKLFKTFIPPARPSMKPGSHQTYIEVAYTER